MLNVGSGKIFVKNYYSLISSGAERSMLEFRSKGLLARAKPRPDLVKQGYCPRIYLTIDGSENSYTK